MDRRLRPIVAQTTLQQERELELTIGGIASLNLFCLVRLTGNLDVALIPTTLDKIALRHEVLRTSFRNRGQYFVQVIDVRLPFCRFRCLPDGFDAHVTSPAQAVVSAFIETPINLFVGPLVHAALLRLSADDHLLIYVAPHTILDAVSRVLWFREFTSLYEALSNGASSVGPPLPVQVRSLASWERHGDHSRAMSYWDGQLKRAGVSAPTPITHNRQASDNCTESSAYRATLPAASGRALRSLARLTGTRWALVVLAHLCAVLRAWWRQDEYIVSLVHGNRLLPGTRELIGCLYEHVPMRVALSHDPLMTSFVRQLSDTLAAAEAHVLPWVKARRLFGEVHDLALNCVTIKPEAQRTVWTNGKPVSMTLCDPVPETVPFPAKGPWWGAKITIDVHSMPSRALELNVSVSSSSVSVRDARRLGEGLQLVLEDLVSSPSDEALSTVVDRVRQRDGPL